MKITSWNVNGMRAALRKGFADFLDELAPDVILLQEIRALPEQLPAAWRTPAGWHVHWNPADKKGYAGTAILSREPIELLSLGFDGRDTDGRITHARVGDVQLVSVYLPSGSARPERQQAKEDWMAKFLPWARDLVTSEDPVVIGGDLNIAHTELDIHNPRGNAKNSGFLPHERAWFGDLLATGWSDTLREQVGPVQGPYSWWSNRGRARELDRGWRIDYLLANPAAAARAGACSVLRRGGLEVSDHAPISLVLD